MSDKVIEIMAREIDHRLWDRGAAIPNVESEQALADAQHDSLVRASDVISTLAAAGYRIASPDQVVVPREPMDAEMWWDADDPESPYDSVEDWAASRLFGDDEPVVAEFSFGTVLGCGFYLVEPYSPNEETDDVEYRVSKFQTRGEAEAAQAMLTEGEEG